VSATLKAGWTRFAPHLLWALLGVSLAVHSAFMLDGFGEADAARLALDAMLWHRTGRLETSLAEYRPRTSPLYIHLLKKAIDWGVAPRDLSKVMNWSNVVLGSLCLVPMYLLLRRLAAPQAALATCVLYSFAPAFWLANLYGMPHLPSFAFFLAALLAYAISLEAAGARLILPVLLAAGCLVVACELKADVILCGGAFPGLLLFKRRLTWRNALVGAGILALSVVVVSLHARSIAPSLDSSGGSATRWSERYPFLLGALTEIYNVRALVGSAGPIVLGAIAVAIPYAIIAGGAHRRLALLALLWALPPTLFWGLILGNAARHLMAPLLPLVLVVAASLFTLGFVRQWPAMAFALLILANYAAMPANDAVHFPSSRLFGSVREIQEAVSAAHRGGRWVARLQADKKLVLGTSSIPYVLYEVAVEARSFEVSGQDQMSVVTKEGRREEIAWKYGFERSFAEEAAARREAGWVVCSIERVPTPRKRQDAPQGPRH